MKVKIEVKNRVGYIILNRPEKLNALDIEMVRLIKKELKKFQDDKDINVIVLKSSSERAFCAGGDVVDVYKSYLKIGVDSRKFYDEEFELCKEIYNSKKLIISLLRGIVMGGGVGIGIGARIRICDETTTLAMPETRLGIIPDVGVGYYISKMPRHIGLYFSLIGASIKSSDILKYNFANYCINSKSYSEVEDMIEKLSLEYSDTLEKEISSGLEKYSEDFSNSELESIESELKEFFSAKSLKEMLVTLENSNDKFAIKTLSEIKEKCPLSIAITFYKYDYGKNIDRNQTFEIDKKILSLMQDTDNMSEGIYASMIDKTHVPKFNPENLSQIEESKILRIFD